MMTTVVSRSVAIGVCLAAALLVGGVPEPGATGTKRQNGKIAFVQTMNDHRSVWLVDLDGSNPRVLTPDPSDNARATPSPDGRTLYLQSDRGGDLDIWALAQDGSARNLTPSRGDDYQPDASPDGRRIVFVSERSGNPELWVVDSQSGVSSRVTETSETESMPAWSPDGASVAFTRWQDDDHAAIVIRQLDKGSERRVTDTSVAAWGVRWSPDGRKIAYTAEVPNASRIVILDLETGGSSTLPALAADNMFPDWSPDGTRLVFWANRGFDAGLWNIGADGAAPRKVGTRITLSEFQSVRWTRDGFLFTRAWDIPENLIQTIAVDGSRRFAVTNGLDDDTQPAWSPDGTTLAFTRFLGTNGGYELFRARADGGAVQNLTPSSGDEQQPVWSPNGHSLAYAAPAGPRRLVDIFRMRADGSRRVNLTRLAGNDSEPDWGRNGTIVWAHFSRGKVRRHLGDARRRHESTPPAGGRQNDEEPRVAPNGRTIVFASQRTGRFQIYRMNFDGTGVRRLVASNAKDSEPAWSPDGRFVVFSRVTPTAAAIWIVPAKGGVARKVVDVCLSRDCVDGIEGVSPAWQPMH